MYYKIIIRSYIDKISAIAVFVEVRRCEFSRDPE